MPPRKHRLRQPLHRYAQLCPHSIPRDCNGFGRVSKGPHETQARLLGRSARAFGPYRRPVEGIILATLVVPGLVYERFEAVDGAADAVDEGEWPGQPSSHSAGLVRSTWSTARNREYVVRAFEGGEQCGYRTQARELQSRCI